jgi:adenylate kinase family enzyme
VKRILVIGHPGAGKSTLATELGRIVHLPVIHLDKEFWQPGWVETPRDTWRTRIEEFISRDEWIMDGTYDRTLDLRLARADTVIFLDFLRHVCLWRILKRTANDFGKVRPNMAEGCPERIDPSFVRWVWNYRRNRYPVIRKCLQEWLPPGELVVRRNSDEVLQFLGELGPKG